MDGGWLQHGAVKAIGAGALWINQLAWSTLLAVAGVMLLACLIAAGYSRRRRAEAVERTRVEGQTRALREALRVRLEEPSELLAIDGAPTLGVGEAFARDIEAAAKTIVQEAGGRRGKAKDLLRARLNDSGNGNGPPSLNGSEAACWRQLGALSMLESTGDALRAYTRAAELLPGDAEAQMQAGVLSLRAGRLPAAEALFRRQIELGDGAGARLRYRGLAMLGDVHIAREDHAGALATYEAARAEVLALIAEDPTNAVLRRDLSITCDRIGDVHVANGDREAALESFRKGLEAAQALAASAPHNRTWQHDLSVSYDRVGGILLEKQDHEAALDMFRKGLAVAGGLTLRDPGNPQWQWDLSTSYDRLGDVRIEQGRLEEALASYREGLTIAEALVKLAPERIAWQRDLAASYHRIGLIEAQRGNCSEARELLERGRRIIARLERIARHQAQWRADLSRFDAALDTISS